MKHACINDCKFDVWNTFKLNNWPTLLVVGPDGNIIQKLTEEHNVEAIEHLLFSALTMQAEALERSVERDQEPRMVLSSTFLPIKLEKEKVEEAR